MNLPTAAEIQQALSVVRPHYPETALHTWPLLSQRMGAGVWLKHENHSPVGAFKLRGGLTYLHELLHGTSLASSARPLGVVAASTGNHGQSIARAAQIQGLRAVIVVPKRSNPAKLRAMQALGAELIEHGEDFQAALEFSRLYAEEAGLHAVPSFHPWLVRGVATYGWELFQAFSRPAELAAVIVPIGLGSGFCGLVAAREALQRKVPIIGVVSAHAPAYAESWRAGKKVERESHTRLAEGVACRTPDDQALQIVLKHAHDLIEVTDAEAAQAMRWLAEDAHQMAEGAGALSLAALWKTRHLWQGKHVACVLSGGNVDLMAYPKVLSDESGGFF